jgi:hypothetical protein
VLFPSFNTLSLIENCPEVKLMGKESKMDKEAAARIQSHADRTGKNQDFKERAQRAAEKNK